MISFLRRLFGKRLVHGDGARRGVAGDSSHTMGSYIPTHSAIVPPRPTTIQDIESACGGPMLSDEADSDVVVETIRIEPPKRRPPIFKARLVRDLSDDDDRPAA